MPTSTMRWRSSADDRGAARHVPLNPEHTDNFAYDVTAAREKEEKLMAQTMAAINE